MKNIDLDALAYMNYEDLKQAFSCGAHQFKTIFGKEICSKDCVAACTCKEHPGMLNEALRKEHQCIDRECDNYVERTEKTKSFSTAGNYLKEMKKQQLADGENTFRLAQELTSAEKYSSMRFVRYKILDDGVCQLFYVKMSNVYDFEALKTELQGKITMPIKLTETTTNLDNLTRILKEKPVNNKK